MATRLLLNRVPIGPRDESRKTRRALPNA